MSMFPGFTLPTDGSALTLREAVGQAIGAGSVAWKDRLVHVGKYGRPDEYERVFDDEFARGIVDALLEQIRVSPVRVDGPLPTALGSVIALRFPIAPPPGIEGTAHETKVLTLLSAWDEEKRDWRPQWHSVDTAASWGEDPTEPGVEITVLFEGLTPTPPVTA